MWLHHNAAIRGDGGVHHSVVRTGRACQPLLKLFEDTVARASASSDGALTLVFESGKTMVVQVDDAYEAGNVLGPDDKRVVPARCTCHVGLRRVVTVENRRYNHVARTLRRERYALPRES